MSHSKGEKQKISGNLLSEQAYVYSINSYYCFQIFSINQRGDFFHMPFFFGDYLSSAARPSGFTVLLSRDL